MYFREKPEMLTLCGPCISLLTPFLYVDAMLLVRDWYDTHFLVRPSLKSSGTVYLVTCSLSISIPLAKNLTKKDHFQHLPFFIATR